MSKTGLNSNCKEFIIHVPEKKLKLKHQWNLIWDGKVNLTKRDVCCLPVDKRGWVCSS